MTSRVVKSRSISRDGRSLRVNWYLQANGLWFIGITVTNGKNMPVVTHGANMTDDSADKFAAFHEAAFFSGLEHERDAW